jgi:hypothetical protein
MKIKLRKDAPWPEVAMPEGQVVSKIKWIDEFESASLLAIKKYLEYKEECCIEKEIPLYEEKKTNFSEMSKEELKLFCEQNNIDFSSSDKKSDLLDKVTIFYDPVLSSTDVV